MYQPAGVRSWYLSAAAFAIAVLVQEVLEFAKRPSPRSPTPAARSSWRRKIERGATGTSSWRRVVDVAEDERRSVEPGRRAAAWPGRATMWKSP